MTGRFDKGKRQEGCVTAASRVRATLEHPFLVVKRLWGHAKVRYCRMGKNLAKLHALFALANVHPVRRQLVSP